MLHILLLILKIIGIILLILFGLLFLIIALTLFVPLRYKLSTEKNDTFILDGSITWLLHLLVIKVSFVNKKLSYSVKICGRRFLSSDDEANNTESEKPEGIDFKQAESDETVFEEAEPDVLAIEETKTEAITVEQTEDETVPLEETEDEVIAVEEAETITPDINVEPEEVLVQESDKTKSKEKIPLKEKIRIPFTKLKAFLDSIHNKKKNLEKTFHKIKKKINRIYKFLTNNCTKAAWNHLKKELAYLLKHYAPRKCDGYIHFGFEDPATTGQVLGYLWAVNALLKNHIMIEEDFEQKILEGHLKIKGIIRCCHLIKSLIVLFIDKQVRVTIKRLRKLKG